MMMLASRPQSRLGFKTTTVQASRQYPRLKINAVALKTIARALRQHPR
jgi:hypothetical protein